MSVTCSSYFSILKTIFVEPPTAHALTANANVGSNKIKWFTTLVLILFLIVSCKGKQSEYASKGSISLFDTTSGQYFISTADEKLISTWQEFKYAILISDYKKLKSLSTDSIINSGCTDGKQAIIDGNSFYARCAQTVFSNSLASLVQDSSRIRRAYDYTEKNPMPTLS